MQRWWMSPAPRIGLGMLWIVLGAVLVLAACKSTEPKPSGQAVAGETDATSAEGCYATLPGGKLKLKQKCLNIDIAVAPGTDLETLKSVVVATFEVIGNVHLVGQKKMMTKSHADTFGATDAFTRRLLNKGIGLVERDRAITDTMLAELDYSISGMVEGQTAPAIGEQIGAKVLIVGRYEFSGEFDYATNVQDEVVLGEPRQVGRQSIRIKGLDIEKATVIFDARIAMTARVSKVLMPRTLASFAAERLLDTIEHNGTNRGNHDVQITE